MPKNFWRVLVIAAALLPSAVGSAADPIFRMGLMTDTHWGENEKSFARTSAVLRVFKREKVDLVCHIGDIADLHYPWAYRYYRNKLFPSIFPENPPRELFVYANHDRLLKFSVRGDSAELYAAMRKELEIPNAPNDRIVFRGYPILVFDQFIRREQAEEMLGVAAKEFPDKPIILLDHVPSPKVKTRNWRRAVYAKYPRLVHIYGHVHVPLRDETSIWQDTHTEINAGCLQNWRGSLFGTSPKSKDCFEFAIMDVYADKLVVKRYSTEDGKEFKSPWVVPLPFDPATAPYRDDVRRKNAAAPEFPAGAALKFAADKPFSALNVKFPEAVEGGEVYKYYIRIARKQADGKYRDISRQDCFSEFYLAENKRKGKLSVRISAGFFDAGTEYRITVTPVGFWGGTGKSLETVFTAPSERAKTTLVYESFDPMKDLVFAPDAAERRMAVVDGFYDFRPDRGLLLLPKELWQGGRGTRFRFTIELDSRQSGDRTWTMVLRNASPKNYGSNRLQTIGGNVDGWRYVIELGKRKDEYAYDLLLQEGCPGKIRFNYVKLERID